MSRRRQLKVSILCPTPEKARYAYEDDAEAALWAIWRRVTAQHMTGPVPERVYSCVCGGFHMTKRSAQHAY